ncbi:MAG TPA: hypothetical protein VJ778_11375 [Burkholderiales bacterium]|nr:hypothetical protein [Burkholderiales bacterium]
MITLFSRKRRSEASYEFRSIGFHGDQHLLAVVNDIVVRERIELFIETGTNVGSSLVYFAERYPKVRVLSCEQDKEAWRRACENARGLMNVEIHHLSSSEFMKLLAKRAEVFGKRCLFWLDAHGYGFEWPLREEVRFIAENFETAYVMIDDFKVPGLDCFRYDEYGGQVCSYEFIRDSLGSRPHHVFSPRYTDRTSNHHPLVGWGLITLGTEYSIPSGLQNLVVAARR